MTDNGDDVSTPQRIARLVDLAVATDPATALNARLEPSSEPSSAVRVTTAPNAPDTSPADGTPRARREFAQLLGEFRRTAVLVPFDEHGSLWTAEFNGVRWICAFSDGEALARFAVARGEAGREWTYRTVLGARLLDVMVPMLPGPGGVALDAGSADGMVFPPVAGIVPDEVAVDLGGTGTR
ncbi:SseB family protein [Streptomyces sp. NPDC047434]|uniref:SseB family protein n=1 Tax=Streptomyces sp. NPDC047434 TaxID=3155143 RepID=UPI0033C4777C